MRRLPILFLFLLFCCSPSLRAQSPPAFSFEIKKPKNLEDKQLPSEKTGDKKFTLPRRVYQNTVTHYNWYFNGKEKLKEILARAKDAYKDDYTKLLTFYNYTIEQTARDSIELDSVIIKANSGILLHDLRNDWIDNLYLLMGKAYFYKGIYDTAFMNLQYINYAFAPKEKDGYDKLIGSNANEGGNAFSISSPETKNLFKKIISHTPSRNESFIWQIHTFIAREEYTEAASMIETLKNDPLFPQRLRTSISEMQALWFYQQHIYDSAARHLEDALPNAFNHEEKARWEYLIGQLYELSNHPDLARNFFERAVKHTLNPILEVYSRLNVIRQNRGDDKIITENIASLVRMARKDRYTNYRDIIYFAAAQMELERNNVAGAKDLLLKSTRSTTENAADPNQKSKSFLLLGDLSFNEGSYSDAKKFYDSVNVMEVVPDTEKFERRKGVLTTMAQNADIIIRQDSLQRWADMPEAEREILLKKLAKKLRKLEGLKEEEELYIPTNTAAPANPVAAAPDLTDNAKGDWYFYNNSLRSKGYNEFRSTWGNRPNVDNWRRSDLVAKAIQQKFNNPETADAKTAEEEKESQGTTYESLLKGLPLTAESRKKSNDSIAQAQLEIGKSLMEGLEDYAAAIKTLEGFRDRFPEHPSMAKALLDLFYCYQKLGMMAEADAIKKLLQDKYKDSEQAGMVEQSTSPKKDAASNDDMTRRYEKIYTLFIEGQFESAMAEKKAADQLYKNNYWTPQLLYIQSIYLIKERQDESALSVLSDLIKLFPGTPMAGKAERLMEVLGRRLEIENYLRDLKVNRPAEEKTVIIDETPPVIPITSPPPARVEAPPAVPTTPVKDTVVAMPSPAAQETVAPVQPPAVAKDSVVALPPVPLKEAPPVQPKAVDSTELNPPKEPLKEIVAAEPKKTDSNLVKEPIRKPEPKKDTVALALQNPVAEVAKTPVRDSSRTIISKDTAKAAPVQSKDTVITRKVPSTKDSVVQNAIKKPAVVNPAKDSLPVVKKETPPQPVAPPPNVAPALVNGLFVKDKESGHLVLLVLDKVDRIFVNEARNAFNRYNAQYPASRPLESLIEPLNDNIKFLVMQPFENATQASAYVQRVDKLAATELIPWLPKEKYSFIIVNAKNMETIRSMKSVSEYIASLKQLYPD